MVAVSSVGRGDDQEPRGSQIPSLAWGLGSCAQADWGPGSGWGALSFTSLQCLWTCAPMWQRWYMVVGTRVFIRGQGAQPLPLKVADTGLCQNGGPSSLGCEKIKIGGCRIFTEGTDRSLTSICGSNASRHFSTDVVELTGGGWSNRFLKSLSNKRPAIDQSDC